MTYDGIFLPGGMPGAERLRDSKPLITALKSQKQAGRWYGAICASPAVVLETHGLLADCQATCYPSFAHTLKDASKADQRVHVSNNCVTSAGPGTSIEYAVRIVELLLGAAKAKAVADPLLMPK